MCFPLLLETVVIVTPWQARFRQNGRCGYVLKPTISPWTYKHIKSMRPFLKAKPGASPLQQVLVPPDGTAKGPPIAPAMTATDDPGFKGIAFPPALSVSVNTSSGTGVSIPPALTVANGGGINTSNPPTVPLSSDAAPTTVVASVTQRSDTSSADGAALVDASGSSESPVDVAVATRGGSTSADVSTVATAALPATTSVLPPLPPLPPKPALPAAVSTTVALSSAVAGIAGVDGSLGWGDSGRALLGDGVSQALAAIVAPIDPYSHDAAGPGTGASGSGSGPSTPVTTVNLTPFQALPRNSGSVQPSAALAPSRSPWYSEDMQLSKRASDAIGPGGSGTILMELDSAIALANSRDRLNSEGVPPCRDDDGVWPYFRASDVGARARMCAVVLAC